MEDYQKEYLQRLASRIEALEAARDGLLQNTEESEASLRRLAHSLRGSGATYGFAEISDLAARVEEAPLEKLRPRVDEFIGLLRDLRSFAGADQDRILIVDDSEEILLILSTILSNQGYRVETAETAAAAAEILDRESVQLIILDLVLPDTDGRNFLMSLRDSHATANIPILVLSAKSTPQTKAECFALGANDYFEKPVDPILLNTRVAAALQSARQMEQESRRDLLTNLPNRPALKEYFASLTSQIARTGEQASLALVDLDHFKQINDRFGHAAGDAALRHTAKLLKDSVRAADFVARWGGEEFVVLLPRTAPDTAQKVLEGVREKLVAEPFKTGRGSTELNFSAGVTVLEEKVELESAVSAADHLLYHAKEAGRGLVLRAESEIRIKTRRILLAEDDSLTAEFILHRLTKAGFDIQHFDQGDLAFKAAAKERFDLGIFDVKMPGMDGFELVQRVRADSANQRTPILILSSMGRESDIARGLSLGANDYMLKPFSPTELLARVHRLLL